VAAGLMTRFTTLIVVILLLPHRIGPTFFRLVNAILGPILLGFATFRAIVLKGHFLRQNSYSTIQVVNPFPRRTSSSAGLVCTSA
jgi:hypothetical protein